MAWLHFRCHVRMCFLSLSASISPNTLNHMAYIFKFSSRKVHNSVEIFFSPNDLWFAVAGCSDSLLFVILPVNCMPEWGQASPVVVGKGWAAGALPPLSAVPFAPPKQHLPYCYREIIHILLISFNLHLCL